MLSGLTLLSSLEPVVWLRSEAELMVIHFEARLWLSVTAHISCL